MHVEQHAELASDLVETRMQRGCNIPGKRTSSSPFRMSRSLLGCLACVSCHVDEPGGINVFDVDPKPIAIASVTMTSEPSWLMD